MPGAHLNQTDRIDELQKVDITFNIVLLGRVLTFKTNSQLVHLIHNTHTNKKVTQILNIIRMYQSPRMADDVFLRSIELLNMKFHFDGKEKREKK